MRAYLNKYDKDGNTGLGSEWVTITREYKTMGTLYQYGIVPMLRAWDGRLKAEIFYNWDNRYGNPDRVMIWNTHILA
jgi:hypothetical protein